MDLKALTATPCSVLIQSTLENDLSFLISHFLERHLSLESRILLVTVTNDANHYLKILKKLGASSVNTDKLLILDLISLQKCDQLTFVRSFENLFKEMLQKIQSWDKTDSSQLVVIVESMSALHWLNDQTDKLLSFCRYCINLGRIWNREPSSFVTCIHGDVHPLASLFDFVIQPKPINLISIANVDGVIRIKQNTLLSNESTSTHLHFSTELYYRLRDTGILFFPHIDLDL